MIAVKNQTFGCLQCITLSENILKINKLLPQWEKQAHLKITRQGAIEICICVILYTYIVYTYSTINVCFGKGGKIN